MIRTKALREVQQTLLYRRRLLYPACDFRWLYEILGRSIDRYWEQLYIWLVSTFQRFAGLLSSMGRSAERTLSALYGNVLRSQLWLLALGPQR
jgi:hypothetical protein